jgi:protein-S-isoprenylcysteine O-methyltransferase Ste14
MLLSIALWVVFSVYWELAAKNAAPVENAESATSRRIHLVLVSLGQLLVLLPVPGLRARFIPASIPVAAAGLGIQVGCLWLALWARRCLGRNWSGRIATTVDQHLVRAGPYRLVRHPIYSALLGMYLGTTIVSGEMHAPLGCAVVIAAYWRKVRLEERHLHDAFGPSYREYSDTTWRLIPGLY